MLTWFVQILAAAWWVITETWWLGYGIGLRIRRSLQ